MRIISGIYRGRVLKSPPTLKTRPTSDRLRESLFNILNPQISEETRILDLCAGTGAIGIEAVSRGAGFATFVDKSRRICALIEQNLDLLQIPEVETEVVHGDAEDFLRRTSESWNIIYFDPPYDSDYADVLRKIGAPEAKILAADGVLIAEHHAKSQLPDQMLELRRWRIVKQGDSCLSFYERN